MELIKTHIANGVLHIVLNRPDKKNALTRTMYQMMADAIVDANDNDAIRVIRFSGEGDCFTAGNDISDFANLEEGQHVPETAAFMRALTDCKLPVIAQVHGLAVGIGTTLLLHCDFVYAEPKARFVLPFINLGLVPEYASSYLLPKIAGHIKASEWLMLGEPISAQEAHDFGMLTAIVSNDTLAAVVDEVCAKLTAKPAFALLHTKALLKRENEKIHQVMNEEFDIFLDAMNSPAAQEAFDAFLNKRPINPEKFK